MGSADERLLTGLGNRRCGGWRWARFWSDWREQAGPGFVLAAGPVAGLERLGRG
ncbi:hypothetical protein SCATT_p08220 (plasmid) [Streptantibioticus cattleyicolor NRRL 8057 = DSM 46488]|uniref:Uncharacterized protein n=1 Tax=Streptantibioticus cattleyicolor (strain ATCC 35852 / DSM 46488 / JCM 4925 / NBRC 14057 / NRRL 8057) TaxID=1003195 RepID=G8XD69_STREN|nr:hypothetical protein SCATT_p08220 [Streptantibioticus cattleyicolor NRRL 8057 = DSM 46488]